MKRHQGKLVKVVRTEVRWRETESGVRWHQRIEVLECGHEQAPRQDCFGETNAVRRRCRRCPL